MKDKEGDPQNLFELVSLLRKKNTPKSEYRLHVNRFLESKARRNRIPVRGVFELTPFCNLNCKMCYIHLGSNQIERKGLLSVDIWKEIMKEAHENGMFSASLTGGECLTYPGFDELFLYLKELGVRVGILSNGLLIDEKRIAFFKRHNPYSIQITLYGGSDDEYEMVTGKRVFKTVVENIKGLRDAGLPVSITITPNYYMSPDYNKILETVNMLGVHYNINSKLVPPRANTGRNKKDLTTEQYIELFKRQREIKNEKLEPIDPSELPDETHYVFDKRVFGLKCGAGRSCFTIKYDGVMCLCSGLDEYEALPLEDGFNAAWKRLNDIADHFLMPVECIDCVYKKYCITCPAMHKEAASGHCDISICERTKKFASIGFFDLRTKDS